MTLGQGDDLLFAIRFFTSNLLSFGIGIQVLLLLKYAGPLGQQYPDQSTDCKDEDERKKY